MKTVERLLQCAAAEIGVTEYPPGSNRVKYNTWFYGKEVSGASYPWCCVFVCWVFQRAGLGGLLCKTGGCTTMMNHFKWMGRLVPAKEARAGDLVFFQFDKDAYADHIGIVERVTGSGVVSIEGNTSVTSDDNGGAVMRRSRKWGVIMAVARPDYESAEKGETDEMSEQEVKELVVREVQRMLAANAQKRFQRSEELPVWAKDTVEGLMEWGIVKGDESGRLNLSEDMVRLLVMAARLVKKAGDAA